MILIFLATCVITYFVVIILASIHFSNEYKINEPTLSRKNKDFERTLILAFVISMFVGIIIHYLFHSYNS